ncbi:MAG: PEP-CTERM sorting domain-containing protein [Burkholderiaceae bacterium]|nr:PEP-CTERM sorting domain-containing protein [Burkholderiaceae bacterium]
MHSIPIPRTLVAGAVVGIAAMWGAIGTAQAAPLLSIAPNIHQETLGDAGGTQYPIGVTPVRGVGLPSVAGNWPNPPAPGFSTEPGFGTGISGFHASYLSLSEGTNVTFQYMGKGDSSLANQFWVDSDNNGSIDLKLFDSTTSSCTMAGPTSPVCGAGSEFTAFFSAGLIPFMYVTGEAVSLINDGINNPDTALGTSPGFFLGADPYLASGQFDTSGSVVYAGLTDLPAGGDHDFQDMGVRISVPEPSGLALAGLALGGVAFVRRRANKA